MNLMSGMMKQCLIVWEDEMPWFTATGECMEGSGDWGHTGQIQSLGNLQADNDQHAWVLAKSYFPGGWKIISIIEQDHCHDGVCGCVKKDID